MTRPQLRCVSWNIHRAKGADGWVNPVGITNAIGQSIVPLQPDVLALQEADEECRPHRRIIDVEQISRMTGLTYQHKAAVMRWGAESSGFLGTILFLHPNFQPTHREVIDLPGHCHRGAVIVEAGAGLVPFRLISAHLSLAQPFRIAQMRTIGQYLYRRPQMQTVLLGDFNEWRPWRGLAFNARLIGRAFKGPAKATFPSRFPILPLDRIMTDRQGSISDLRVITTGALRSASDHLPVAASVTLGKV